MSRVSRGSGAKHVAGVSANVSICCRELTEPPKHSGDKPWDGTEVSGSFGVILPGEPHLQQLLSPFEEVCTVIFHHETTDTQQKY